MELESNQNSKKSNWGGKRKGAGRPSTIPDQEQVSKKMRRKFNEYVTEEQISGIIASAIQKAEDGDVAMQKFLMEQWFGKATQRQEISGEEGGPISIQGFNYIVPETTVYLEEDYDSDNLTSS